MMHQNTIPKYTYETIAEVKREELAQLQNIFEQ